MRILISILFACSLLARSPAEEPRPTPSGNATIRNAAGPSEIVITTTSRLAGAIHSLTWNGKEFIDSHDHGRQLQSAASFATSFGPKFWAEQFNPTEAGSRADGRGEKTSSKLLHLLAGDSALETRTQMAFWLAPGENSSGRPALNEAALSNHLLAKRVRIGYRNLPHVIDYNVTFTVPAGERHAFAQFEALTGYMPPEFSTFWSTDADGILHVLTDGPGEQNRPIVFATADGNHAMGIFSPNQPSRGFENAGYGRFRFATEKVVKWNCVFRVQSPSGIPTGEHSFRLFVPVGSLKDVQTSLYVLINEFAKP